MIDKLSSIRLLAMDVDGTLTDGSMIFLGGEQVKMFSVYDGLGIRLAMNYGLKIAWVTGNVTDSVVQRAKSLGVTDVYQGARLKSIAMKQIASDHGLSMDQIAYIGDDLNDIPAFECAGVSFATANAVDEVKDRADLITAHRGGQGAVREAIETILKSTGKWAEAVDSFIAELAREETEGKGPEAVA